MRGLLSALRRSCDCAEKPKGTVTHWALRLGTWGPEGAAALGCSAFWGWGERAGWAQGISKSMFRRVQGTLLAENHATRGIGHIRGRAGLGQQAMPPGRTPCMAENPPPGSLHLPRDPLSPRAHGAAAG